MILSQPIKSVRTEIFYKLNRPLWDMTYIAIDAWAFNAVQNATWAATWETAWEDEWASDFFKTLDMEKQ